MSTQEVRLERLRPAEITAALERAPVAWIPLGALEDHADHLPNGTAYDPLSRLRQHVAHRRGPSLVRSR